MSIWVVIINDEDWQWNGENSVLVNTKSLGGCFSTKELANAFSVEKDTDIIETKLDQGNPCINT